MAGRKNKEEAMCGTEGTQHGETGRPKETTEAAAGLGRGMEAWFLSPAKFLLP